MSLSRRSFLKGIASLPIVIAAPSLIVNDRPLIEGAPAYISFWKLPLADFCNRVPVMRAEVYNAQGKTVVDGFLWHTSSLIEEVKWRTMQPIQVWNKGGYLTYDDLRDMNAMESYHLYFRDVSWALPSGITSVNRVWLDKKEITISDSSDYKMSFGSARPYVMG